MSNSQPSKFFASEKEFTDWTQHVFQGTSGVINGTKVGKGGAVPQCIGISLAQMKKMHDSFNNIDLTKCIAWAYKLVWEAAERQVTDGSYKTKEAAIADWNKKQEWADLVHVDPDTSDSGMDEVMGSIFADAYAPGMGYFRETKGGKTSGGEEKGLFIGAALSEFPWTINDFKTELEKSNNSFKETGTWSLGVDSVEKWDNYVKKYLSWRVGSGIPGLMPLMKYDKFPSHAWVFVPIKRFVTDKFENMKSRDRPKTPSWLDKFCLRYVEKNARVWWHSSPIRGHQHGYGDGGGVYRREAKGELAEWSTQGAVYKSKDPVIQQVFEFKRGWSTLNNFDGRNTPGSIAKKTCVEKTFRGNSYTIHNFCIYNPYTDEYGNCFPNYKLWRLYWGSEKPRKIQWDGEAWNRDAGDGTPGAILAWHDEYSTIGHTWGGFQALHDICEKAMSKINNKGDIQQYFPSNAQRYDLETALQIIRLGPLDSNDKESFDESTYHDDLKGMVDRLFNDDAGMGKKVKDFPNKLTTESNEYDRPAFEGKLNLRHESQFSVSNAFQGVNKEATCRMNLLDPVYKIDVNRPWMTWAIRMVIYLIDSSNKGIFKNQRTGVKPFQRGLGAGTMYVQFLINITWALFEEFAKMAKVITKVQENNDSISEKSPSVVKQKNVSKQIQKNMQCFMLNLIDHFASYHTTVEGTFDWLDTYEFLRITGDNSNIFNLVGYKPHTINRMLSLTPEQLAIMQPRIKLYKERKVTRAGTFTGHMAGDSKTQIVEVEGPFSTHTNTDHLSTMLKSGTGRSMGGGIKEISIKQEGGDADFDVPSLVEVEIVFLFNTMQEIFLNFPSFDPATSKVSFPYGVDPKYSHLTGQSDPKKLAKLPASYAELIFPINTKKSDYLASFLEGGESTSVILEVGWTLPEDLKKLEASAAVAFQDLSQQNMFRSYLLTPFDSEFNFTNEGQVELTARYHGIIRGLQINTANKLFPAAGVRGMPLSEEKGHVPLWKNPELKKWVDEINKLENKRSRGKLLTGPEDTKLLQLKDKVRSKVLFTKSAQFDDFVEKQLQSFIDNLFAGDGAIYTAEVPKAFLGARTTDKNILKWRPTQDIDLMRRFPRSVSRGVGMTSTTRDKLSKAVSDGQEANKKAQSKAEYDAAKVAIEANPWETDEEKKKKLAKLKEDYEKSAKVSKKSSLIKKKAKEAMKKHTQGFDIEKDMWPITFFYFGDFMQSVLDFSYTHYSLFAKEMGVRESLPPSDKLNYILGTLVVPIIKGKVQVLYSINLADLPITLDHLSNYIIDTLIGPQAYKMTRLNFIWGLLKSVIRDYFNSDCFVGQYDTTQTKPQLTIFNMPSFQKKEKRDGDGGIWRLSTGVWKSGRSKTGKTAGDRGSTILWSKEKFKSRMQQFEAESKTNKQNINKRKQYKYAFLGSRSMTHGSFDRRKDMAANIHHFYFGSGIGLLKNISFKSEELEGMTESLLLEGISAVNPQATAFIPRLFNCTLSMIGNTLFDPGQTFYVDPTMGTMLGQPGSKNKNSSGINVIRDTGLGGYFYIASIETRIAPGVFETTVEGLKTGIAKKADSRHVFHPANPKETPKKKTPATPNPAKPKKKKTKKGATPKTSKPASTAIKKTVKKKKKKGK